MNQMSATKPILSSSYVEVAVDSLRHLILRTECVTLYGIGMEEIPDPDVPGVALLNLTASYENFSGGPIALCAMLHGKDATHEVIWSGCFFGQLDANGTSGLLEPLLISMTHVGKTVRIGIRLNAVAGIEPAKSDRFESQLERRM